jgi:hypothetical protein
MWGDIRLINFDIIFEKTCLFRQKKEALARGGTRLELNTIFCS